MSEYLGLDEAWRIVRSVVTRFGDVDEQRAADEVGARIALLKLDLDSAQMNAQEAALNLKRAQERNR